MKFEPSRRDRPLKTWILLAVIIVSNSFGNVVLSHGMRQVGEIASYSPIELVASGVAAMANPWVIGGVALLLVFFIAHAVVLNWADLSYVLLVTSIGYVLVALMSRFALGEQISTLRWVGTVAITAGVALAGSTPASTFSRGRQA